MLPARLHKTTLQVRRLRWELWTFLGSNLLETFFASAIAPRPPQRDHFPHQYSIPAAVPCTKQFKGLEEWFHAHINQAPGQTIPRRQEKRKQTSAGSRLVLVEGKSVSTVIGSAPNRCERTTGCSAGFHVAAYRPSVQSVAVNLELHRATAKN